MAVLKVTEDWRGRTGGYAVTTAEHNRRFDVTLDNADLPENRPFIALTAVDPSTGVAVPQGLAAHPYSPWLFVTNVRYNAAGPFDYVIEVTYGVKPATSFEWPTFANPLSSPWEIEYFGVDTEEAIESAFDDLGNLNVPIVNANDEPPDPFPTQTFSYLGIRITRYESLFSEMNAYLYRNSVSSDNWRGYPPYHVKCTRFDGRRVIGANGGLFWQVCYEFVINAFSWQRRFLHMGFHVSNWVGTEKHINKAIDDNGDFVAEPVPLTQNGAKLMPGQPKTWLTFNTYKARPFSVLNLNF